ncbi:MAG: hypothetical protein IAE82_13375 [Opitutaceae bacterium]|nr:hypothetical protein [Opitutaceae bacterium]
MTRRDFFSSMLPSRWAQRPTSAPVLAERDPSTPAVAVIAGRHCLAYQGSFCSTCRERCPIPGAIVVERGLPHVNPALCDGCRICHDLCPAPVNAVLMTVPQASSLPARTQAGSLLHSDHA